MPQSPRGRDIETVEGSPGEITARGTAIETLGQQMLDSADTLEDIATRAIEDGSQKGKAIAALKDAIGESYDVLRQAGELYEPVGPVIRTYGEELESIKPSIDAHAGNCETLWTEFQALPGSVEPRGTGGLFEPDEGSDEAEQNAEEDALKKQAYDDWVAEAEAFDTDYDTWENAFDAAVNDIGEEMGGSIKDGFWEFLEDLGTVLSWAAFAVGIIALVIGGPFTLIAFGLAAAFFAVTAIQVAGGKKGWGDLALAALGVLPVGKLANMTKLLHGGRGVSKFLTGARLSRGGFDELVKPTRSLINVFQNNGFRQGMRYLFTGNGVIGAFTRRGPKGGLSQLFTGTTGYHTVLRNHQRFYQGTSAIDVMMRGSTSVRITAGADFGLTALGNMLGHWGRGETATGGGLPGTVPKPVGVFL